MKKCPWLWLAFGIIILIVPTVIYLCFLIPKLTDEYNILMASSGVIGGAGLYGADKIPQSFKMSGLFKLAARSFTLLTCVTLVQEFVGELIALVCIFVVSFIIFKIFIEVWKSARRKKENAELANEIARGITENIK